MKRDLNKAIEDYKRKFWKRGEQKGALFASDYQQIWDMSNGDSFHCVDNALMAGFMIGYRCAKRENRKGRA